MRNLFLLFALLQFFIGGAQSKPNVIIIYADDLGYGDLGSYGATKINTPDIDKLAASGIRFTNGHSTAATCTPSRYSLLTGMYPWRTGAAILPGDAKLIVPQDKPTLATIFKKAGYITSIVGKWHLGLGSAVQKDWNNDVKPGPLELGFDESYIFPATADRVPTVFLDGRKVVGLEANDPIEVNYKEKIGNEATGLNNPELLKMKASPNHGHNNTIVNGIGRIGWMTGGKAARWTDEEVGTTFLFKAQEFIERNADRPFFLFFALTEPHVPRMPATMFKGKSGLGFRGDAILQIDWTVGQIMKQLKALKIDRNTMIIFSSDNGPVLDDGYEDGAVTMLNGHTPAGVLRGGKYSAFEAGTRVPLIISWPQKIKPGTSDALVSQVDFMASFKSMFRQPSSKELDSENMLSAFLGTSKKGRTVYIAQGGALSITENGWKYIEPHKGPAVLALTNIESGNLAEPQLYHLNSDLSEKINLAEKYPQKVKELAEKLSKIKSR